MFAEVLNREYQLVSTAAEIYSSLAANSWCRASRMAEQLVAMQKDFESEVEEVAEANQMRRSPPVVLMTLTPQDLAVLFKLLLGAK